MVHVVTYLELYLRRLDVLKRMYSPRSDHGSGHDAGLSGAAPRAPVSPGIAASETNTTHNSVHAQLTGKTTDLDNSGLISAHVPDRGGNAFEDAPYLVGCHKHEDSAIPLSPTAFVRCQTHWQVVFSPPPKTKIPRRPLPYGAMAIRSHPLALGVIQFCQNEASAEQKGDAQRGKGESGSPHQLGDSPMATYQGSVSGRVQDPKQTETTDLVIKDVCLGCSPSRSLGGLSDPFVAMQEHFLTHTFRLLTRCP